MKQSTAFWGGEGKKWFERNKRKLKAKDDPVIEVIKKLPNIDKAKTLEVGCSNGWRLKELQESYPEMKVFGVDPAAMKHTEMLVPFDRAPASNLDDFFDGQFNIVIYGWCLYLCDPEDYLRIASEGDRVLRDGGYIIIYDFHTDSPYKVPYKHKKGIFSHHYNFSKLWLGSPVYSLYRMTVQDETCVTVLKKNLKTAFPEEK